MPIELKKPKYVQGPWRDELDRPRCRFRRPGHPGCELPVRDDLTYLDFPEFWTAYLAALKSEIATAALAVAAARSGAGTVKNAVETYLTSTSFLDGSEKSTQALRRPILNRLLKPGIAELPLVKMDEAYIARWLEQAPTKGAQNTRLLALRPF